MIIINDYNGIEALTNGILVMIIIIAIVIIEILGYNGDTPYTPQSPCGRH
jgi:hypothetical protein